MTPEKRAGQSAAGELGSNLDVLQLEVDKNEGLVSLEPGSWFVCFVPGLQKQWWHPFVRKVHKHVFARS